MRLVLVLLMAMVAVGAARNGLNTKNKELDGEEKDENVKRDVKADEDVKAEEDVKAQREAEDEKDVESERNSDDRSDRYYYWGNDSTTAETTPYPTWEATSTSPPPTYRPPPPLIPNARPADCADYLMLGYTWSGVYVIYPFTCTCNKGVEVWCDMETDGGGWTVFLKRQNATYQLDFNRTWAEYKEGFGNPYIEYYIGNENLHSMTLSRSYTLRLDVEMATGGLNYATYETISVADEDDRYKMDLSGSSMGTSSATYCFKYLDDRYFTTIDRDYDSYSGNCAANQGGGWWYYNCRYFNPTNAFFNHTLEVTCYNSKMIVTSLQLKIRPKICDASIKTIHLKEYGCDCHRPH